jgi:hypothetical protein
MGKAMLSLLMLDWLDWSVDKMKLCAFSKAWDGILFAKKHGCLLSQVSDGYFSRFPGTSGGFGSQRGCISTCPCFTMFHLVLMMTLQYIPMSQKAGRNMSR